MQLPKTFFIAVTLVIIGLTLRFLLFSATEPFTPQYEKTILTADAPGYYNLAKSLAKDNQFNLGKQEKFALWVPGYPFFASGIFRLTSVKLENVIITQIFISSLLPVLFFFFTRDIFSPKLRLTIAAIFAVEPNSIIFSNLFLSETVFTFILMCFFIAYVRFIKNKKIGWLVAAAFCLGIATLIRAVNQYLFIIIAVHLAFILIRYHRINIARAFLVFIVGYVLVVSLWMARNYYHWNHFKLCAGMGYNLIMNNIAITDSQNLQVSKKQLREKYFHEADAFMEIQSNNPFEIDAVRKTWALNKIKNEFSYYFFGHLEEVKKIYFDHNEFIMFFNNYLGISVIDYKTKLVPYKGRTRSYKTRVLKDQFQKIKTSMTWLHIIATSVFLLYLASNIFWKDKQFKYISICMIIIAYFPLLSSASAASRFRVPIVYYLIIGTCCSLAHLYSNTAYMLQKPEKFQQEQPSVAGTRKNKKKQGKKR